MPFLRFAGGERHNSDVAVVHTSRTSGDIPKVFRRHVLPIWILVGRQHDPGNRKVHPLCEGCGRNQHVQAVAFGQPLDQGPRFVGHPGVVNPDSVVQQLGQRIVRAELLSQKCLRPLDIYAGVRSIVFRALEP